MDGEEFFTEVLLSPVQIKGENKIQAIVRDISKRKRAEAALRESEARYRSIIDQSIIGFVMIQGTKIVFVNQKMAEIMGYQRLQDMVGKDIKLFLPTHSYRQAKNALENEYVAINKRGKKVHLRVFQKRVLINNKVFVQAFVMDMTERRDIEGKLLKRAREINVLYRVYSHTKMIWHLTRVFSSIAKDITYAFATPALMQTEIVFDGKTYSYPKRKKPFLMCKEEPLVISNVHRGKIRVGYIKRANSDIDSTFLHEELELIENVAQILQKYMYSREIIERHKTIVHKSFTGIFIVKKGRLAYVNPRFCRLVGRKEDQIIGQPLSHFIPDYSKMATGTDGRRRETYAKKKNGNVIDIALTMQPMNYHGDLVTLGSIEDITRLKTAEKKLNNFNVELRALIDEKTLHLERANERLRSLNDLKDEFIATTSHELRSPLTSVRGYLSFLMEKDSLERIPDDLRPHLRRVHQNTETLDHLINNILDVSRVETGRFTLQVKPFDFVSLAKKVTEELSFQAGQKDIKILLKNIPKTLILSADYIRIYQILRNLLDNAIKFSPHGGDIVVKMRQNDQDVFLEIVDHGIGMPKETISHIFDKFVRIKRDSARYSGGTGLGLFVSKHIVELHHGSISVKSKLGKGSTFTIRLPLTQKK